MKSKLFIINIVAVFAASTFLFGEETGKNYLMTIGDSQVGGYIGLNGRASSVFSETGGFVDGKIGVVLNNKWTIGLTGSALTHDQQYDKLVDDGTYHLFVNYGGLFVERIFSINQDFKWSLGLMTGQGIAYYEYDKEFQKDKVWTEKIIDKTTFGVQELSLEIQHRVVGNFWLGVNGSIRNTSPIRLIGTSSEFLKKPSFGFSLKYGIL